MVIGGQTHTSDLMIYPDGRVEDGWRRASGHQLVRADIEDLIASHPALIVVGTGIYGRMQLSKELEDFLAQEKIELKAQNTETAARLFNTARQSQRPVAACFHLTC